MVIIAFGKVLKDLREKNEISQEVLAGYCDLDRTYISLLERGKRQPTITTIFKLAEFFGKKPSELINDVEDKLKELKKQTNPHQ